MKGPDSGPNVCVTNDGLEKGVDDAMANRAEWKKMLCCTDTK